MEEVYYGIAVIILSKLVRMHFGRGILWYRCYHFWQIVEDAIWKRYIWYRCHFKQIVEDA